jgi:hypothetical protein
MEKKIVMVLCILAIFMFACSSPEVTSRKLTPTGALAHPEPIKVHEAKNVQPIEKEDPENQQTAAEALQEVKETWDDQPTATVKSASSIYGTVETTKTGKDALAEKTRAAYSTGSGLAEDIDADKEFGSKYHSNSGKLTNLPDGYGEGHSFE